MRHRSSLLPMRALLGLALLAGTIACSAGFARSNPVALPDPKLDVPASGPQTAVFAGGCFWGVEGVFEHVKGVTSATSGYSGGAANTANYDTVSTGTTGHAESVQVTFDPSKISYGKILQIYFSVAHDPTELNYQGPDMGPQYRSAIFPASEEQARVAKAYIAQLDAAHVFSDSIVTTIEPGRKFYPAEDYHQDFLIKNPNYPYIVFNDLPKIRNLQRLYPNYYAQARVS